MAFDGKSIKKGDISFQPAAETDRAEGAEMIDGKFTMTAIAGEQKVEIQGVRAKPVESPKGDAVDEEENDVPDRCRRKTELTAEVMENVKVNQFTFELTSRP